MATGVICVRERPPRRVSHRGQLVTAVVAQGGRVAVAIDQFGQLAGRGEDILSLGRAIGVGEGVGAVAVLHQSGEAVRRRHEHVAHRSEGGRGSRVEVDGRVTRAIEGQVDVVVVGPAKA